MDGYLPLKPGSATFSFAGTPAASAAALVFPNPGEAVYIFDNSRNTVAAWIGFGTTSTIAQTNAAIPGPGGISSAQTICIGKGTVQAFTLGGNLFFSTIMEQGSGTVTGIAGYGI